MRIMNYPKTKFPFYVALSITFLLTSCGSYQYVGYDNDGIYGSDDRVVEEEVVYEKATTVEVDDNSYYKNYFTEKDNLYSTIPTDDSAIFTDIDSYSSDYVEEDDEQAGRAGWGNANDSVTINFYDNGWNNWGWNGWGWNAGFGWGNPWGWGWNGWYRPWGWNSWAWNGWGPGWGWGWNNWGWNAGFGWGWNNWGWNNGFYSPYYRNNYAFNAGRRGANINGLNRNALYSNRANANYSRRSNVSAQNRSSFNPRRNSNSNVRNTRSVRSRSNNSSVRPNTRTRSNSPSVRTRTRSNSNSRSRMSTPSRSRSSSPAMRSSGGSMRSGGGSMRSGGGSRGGGRRG